MQLKYIELQGFKSFPDKTVINFGKGITAIVGPNGSGKSNIADAVRWVMGETSSKTLRGQKMEDVIFDGTAMRKPLGFAEVSLVLDNSDRTVAIEYDEIAITRRYYRSGESEYYINRAEVRLRDIQDLLRDTGLGKTGYSIIGQGAITEIIASKSADRRALFEEAAGISKFKHKKDESVKKLNQTQDNIERINDIVFELEGRLGPLEKQSQKARKYLALREERKGLEITLWINRLDKIKEILVSAEQQTAELKNSYENTERDLEKTESRITELSATVESLTAEVELMRAQNKEQEEQIAARQSQILVAENDIVHAEKDIERLNSSKEEGEADRLKSEKEIAFHNEKIIEFEKRLEENTAEIEELQKVGESILSQQQQIVADGININIEIEKINAALTVIKVRLGSLEQAEQTRSEYIKEKNQEIEDAKERLNVLIASRERAKEEKKSIETRLEENKNIRGGYESKLHNAKERLENVRTEINKKTLHLSEISNRLKILSDMEKHYDGFQNSVKVIMTEASRGSLRGIEGTVADLIEVSSEHSTAVETALGGALQNIVTEDERSSKNCIELLKNRKGGRATFLPISNMKGNRLNIKNIEDEYGFVGLAVDLVKYDKKYDGVMTFLLGRTVVFEDLDCATSVARKNKYSFRIVTLDGQQVNVGGSLTGGSASRNFGILSRHNEIEQLGKDCEKGKVQIEELEDKERKATAELSSITASVSGVEAEQRRLETELVKVNGDIAHYAEYVGNMNSQEAQLLKEIENLSLAKGEDEKERLLLEEKVKASEEELQNKTKALEDNSEKGKNCACLLSQNTETVHKKEIEKTEILNGIEKERTLVLRIEEDLKLRDESKEKILSDIKTLEMQIYAHKQAIEVLKNEQTDISSQAKNSEEAISEKITKRTLCEQETSKLRQSEKDMYDVREKLSREMEKQATKLENITNEKETLTSKIWDEYEMTVSEGRENCIEIEDMAEAQKKVASIRASMKALGEVNLSAVDEYIEVKERYDRLSEQLTDLVTSKTGLEKIIDDLTARMQTVFKEQFKIINEEFEKVFKQLFNGGSAKLELDDPENVLESGIEIFVAPPGKIIKHLSSLSGGEQSLTAIALYFAILTIRPAPFCLLDEIEAALDDVNVVRYAEYLRVHEKTQFIVITHRRGTMEAADRLYGVTMKEKGISRILAIDVDEIEKHI